MRWKAIMKSSARARLASTYSAPRTSRRVCRPLSNISLLVMCAAYAGSLAEVLQHVAQYVRGAFRRLALDAEPLHNLAVPLHVFALVEVEGAGELLEVDHIRQVLVGKAHDRERAGLGNRPAGPERRDLERDPGVLGDLDQVLKLLPEHRGAAHRAPQRGLVHDRPQAGTALLGKQFLPGDPHAYPAL